MFKNSYQSGLLSIFYSCGSNPLAIWDMEVHNGHVKRITDQEVNSIVLEIVSTNVATTFISCPKKNQVLGIRLPFLVMIVKNLKRYFSFEITILDDKNMRRRFRISNFQSTTKIKPFCTSMPIGLSGGWNQIQFNLADFTKRAYGTQFMETLRVQVHANARLRRIYFSDRLYTEEELPQEYKLYLPLERKQKKKEEAAKPAQPAPSKEADQAPGEQEPGAPAEPQPEMKPKQSTARQSMVPPRQSVAHKKPHVPEAAAAAPSAETVPEGEGEEGAKPEGEEKAEGEAPAEGGETVGGGEAKGEEEGGEEGAEAVEPAAGEPADAMAEGEAEAAPEAPPPEEATPAEAPPEAEPPEEAAEAPAE